jgi:hypothetical protein
MPALSNHNASSPDQEIGHLLRGGERETQKEARTPVSSDYSL